MTAVVGMRVHVCMCTRLENGLLHNGQQLGSAVNSLFVHSNFKATKMLSGYRAPRCGKHQFHTKITVNT